MRKFSLHLLWLMIALCACSRLSDPDAGVAGQDARIESDGLGDAPATGPCFVNDAFAFAPTTVGLNIDADPEIDNAMNRAWAPMLGTLNENLLQALRSGRTISAFEVAGLERPYTGDDSAVTFKFYTCADADNDPTNTFCVGDGCAQVLAQPDKFVDGQTPYIGTPGPIVATHYDSGFTHEVEIDIDDNVMILHRARAVVTIPQALDELRDGIMCGANTANDLSKFEFDVCSYLPDLCLVTPLPDDLSLAEYLALLNYQPDIDLDDDGLERFTLDQGGDVASCTDGDGTVIEGVRCLENPRMADGYSICFTFHAVPAQLIIPPWP